MNFDTIFKINKVGCFEMNFDIKICLGPTGPLAFQAS